MKNDIYLTLEKRDLEIRSGDFEFDDDFESVTVYAETYFDVDKKFGLNTESDNSAWVNLYLKYNPWLKTVSAEYVISTDDECIAREYEPTEAECKMMAHIIEEACIKYKNVNCRDLLMRGYFDEVKEISLKCQKISDNEYQIVNEFDMRIVYSEDGTGILKNHVGHEIEYVLCDEGGNDYSYAIECMDCNEVLLSQNYEPESEVVYVETKYEYEQFKIIVSPDYKKAIEFGDAPEVISCEVYSADDVNFEKSLGEFNMMLGFEYDENSVESIEKGINKMMDDSLSFYELQLRENEFKRADELLARAVSYIVELTGIDDLRETLIEKLDMTEAEADDMTQMFETDIEAEQGINLC